MKATIDLDTPIAEVDFVVSPWGKRMATRIQNGLQRGGIMTLSQLVEQTEADLECVDEGIGTVSIVIIKKKLDSMGLKLKSRKDY